ncbi:retrovirus-related pol polyprotein from transposon TNT 1-94 [Tanacetum coccineum]
MLIFSKSLLFLWAEAVATACYTQNCSLIHTHYNKTPYELLRDRKPELKYLRIFGALCYPTNDFEDLRKLKPKADIGIFIGYSPSRKHKTKSTLLIYSFCPAKKGLVKGIPKLKYTKDHLCSACQIGKSKKDSHPHKPEPSTNQKLQMLHMDLCGPMRVESINKKRYILVIIDDYSRFTWVNFVRTKDEAPVIIIKFLKQAQVSLNAIVRYLRTDNGIEFLNQTLSNYTEEVGITHNTSTARTPQQNSVVERRARTMLIFSKSPLFLRAEAVATACYTQNRSLIHTRYNKAPYELLRDRKPELKYLHVFDALCVSY